MSRRYWMSLLVAAVFLFCGLALIGVTLRVDNGAGRLQQSSVRSTGICRSCETFERVDRQVGAVLDGGAARAFLRGLGPWRDTCIGEQKQCYALFVQTGSVEGCDAQLRSWTALETRLASALRDVAKLSVTCEAMSCPVLSCAPAGDLLGNLETGGDALKYIVLAGTPAPKGNPETFSKAIRLLGSGRTALLRLTATLGSEAVDFAGEWAFWQNFGTQLETAGDELFARGDVSPAGHSVFRSGTHAARTVALALEKLGGDMQSSAWQELGDGFGAFLVASARLDELIMRSVSGVQSRTCGSDIADRARRIEATTSQLAQDLSACRNHARCDTETQAEQRRDRFLTTPEAVMQTLEHSVDGLADAAGKMVLSESPPASVSLEFPTYTAREPITVNIEARQNSCAASGSVLALSTVGAGRDDDVLYQSNLQADQPSVTLAAPEQPGAYVFSLLAPAASAGALGPAPLAKVPFEVRAGPEACDGFAGTWDTDFGTMTATLRGNELRGSYQRSGATRPGIIIGTVRDRTMTGTWRSDLGSGGARLVLSSDGQRFSGTWGEKEGEVDGAGLWRGRCVAVAPVR